LSLNSFTNENEIDINRNENMFMKRFDVSNQSSHSIATLKSNDTNTNNDNFQKSKKLPPLHSACYTGTVEQLKKLIGILFYIY
jgi:hypothetical protein